MCKRGTLSKKKERKREREIETISQYYMVKKEILSVSVCVREREFKKREMSVCWPCACVIEKCFVQHNFHLSALTWNKKKSCFKNNKFKLYKSKRSVGVFHSFSKII